MDAPLTLQGWLTLLACSGQLGLAVLASRRNASPLALPLGLLCLGLFSWNFAALAYQVSGDPGWRLLDVALSPLTVPLTANFVVAFVGRSRELRAVVIGLFAVFGLLSAISLLGFLAPWAREFVGSRAWAVLYFSSALAGIGYTLWLLGSHLRGVRDADEVVRTRLVVLALLVGTALGLTELLADMDLPVPRGGNLGTLAAAGVLSIVALRFRLLEDHLPKRVLAYSLALGVLAVALYLGVFTFLRDNHAVVVVCTVTVTAGMLLATQHAVQTLSRKRERLERLAILGRLSAQMAHDLKNPLAAMRGAVAYLSEEVNRGRSLDDQRQFLTLLEEQVRRVTSVVDRYQRVGGLSACREPKSVNDVVRSVLSLQHFAADGATRVEAQLDDALPACTLDAELVERALENLLVNAYEAMPNGGTVTVSTEAARTASGRQAVAITVRDAGTGMDPRAAERVFDDFFTTKPHGTGLGLFLVKRVADVHGGDVHLSSGPGLGTVARLSLPIA